MVDATTTVGNIKYGEVADVTVAGRKSPTGRAKVTISGGPKSAKRRSAVTGSGGIPVIIITIRIPCTGRVISVIGGSEVTVSVISVMINAVIAGGVVGFAEAIGRSGVGISDSMCEIGSGVVSVGTIDLEVGVGEVEAGVFHHPAMVVGIFGDGVSVTVTLVGEGDDIADIEIAAAFPFLHDADGWGPFGIKLKTGGGEVAGGDGSIGAVVGAGAIDGGIPADEAVARFGEIRWY